MGELNDYSGTAASNNAAAPGGWPEGMLAGSLNNSDREFAARLKRWYLDNNGSLATGGTSTAITVTLNAQHSAWFDGLSIWSRVTTTCGATPTLNPTGSGALGAKSLYWPDGTQLAANDIVAGGVYGFYYELTSDKVYVIGAKPSVTITGGDGITVTAGDVDFAPSELSDVALATNDQVVIADTSDSNNPKTATAADFQSLFAASAADQETATSATVNVTPSVQQRHPSAAKCWGNVTVSGGTPTLNESYNVTGIADTATGQLTVTIGTDFAAATYAAIHTVGLANGFPTQASKAAGSIILECRGPAAGLSDPAYYDWIFLGDQ